jgi:hypothetical protein
MNAVPLWLLALIGLVALMAASCTSPQPLPRARLAPPPQERAPVVFAEQVEAEAARSNRDRSPPLPHASRRAMAGDPAGDELPAYRTVTEFVEVPVEDLSIAYSERAPDSSAEIPAVRYSTYDDYLSYRRNGRLRQPNRFPVNTAIGAGIGAIIGHRRGGRGRGALIGGGIGLLFDLGRWSR